ncbi:hypothetical protein QUW58_13065 [Enterocloster aldenensis]|uniref:DUF6809 family protein n=1 Tax=Enterocloster aldenensis TaxID=358742 RepID=UPI0025A3628C|nr:hypothetical protein [Enterocloster aldenensis]
MSKSFMYDLYFGNLVPWERGRAQDPAYTPLTRKISDLKVHFQKLLSPEEYEKFEEMGNLQAQSGTIEDVDLFEYAFCMGVLMMIDVLGFKEKRLTEHENE